MCCLRNGIAVFVLDSGMGLLSLRASGILDRNVIVDDGQSFVNHMDHKLDIAGVVSGGFYGWYGTQWKPWEDLETMTACIMVLLDDGGNHSTVATQGVVVVSRACCHGTGSRS